MRLFLALVFALSALTAGSRSSLQTRRLASFVHGGDESSQVATSRILVQATPKRKIEPEQVPAIPRETKRGKKLYLYYNFSPATHKSLGMFQKKDNAAPAFKRAKPGKSPLGPKTSERRL
ncbi:hypothetical protein LEN26_018637 [Aphanomyces euteiches]|nr:hypothetical protein LEN26_018637 [Aphanomyces euteiches]KAH9114163.1 hypothetical protein AeMF1_011725 [Aphanomyces euteiches]KAH9181079.1 hypothetical protein AeNC1_016945 [Aphanomyces euteiches]